MNRNRVRHWRRIIAGNLIAAAVVVFAFSGVTLHTPAGTIVEAFLISLLFSMCIGPLVGVVMPRIAPWIWRQLSFPFNWTAVALAMAAMAVVGSVVAIGVLITIGQVPAHDFGKWFEGSLRIAIVITLTVGLFITAFETTRAREAQAATQAKLASLESRVQPHFLFNTLNSIAALIHEDPKGAERMTGQLASLMRSSLDQQATPLVALDDELRTVHDYLAIEKVRFGDRLRFTIDGAAATDRARVPRLAVQTLVENSVKYAVSPRREGGTIRITVDDVPNRLRISVEDDGPGFDAASLPDGHGLSLLRERLRLLFGESSSMTIDSGPRGTSIVLLLAHTHDLPSGGRRAPR